MATIYSITSERGDKVYIGSTKQTLAQRKASHKSYKNCNSQMLIKEYGWENCKFTILEECAVEQRYERERYHIEHTPNLVNKMIPGQTKKEYDQKHKDEISRKSHERRELNIEEQRRKDNEFYHKNKDEINRRRRERRSLKKQSDAL